MNEPKHGGKDELPSLSPEEQQKAMGVEAETEDASAAGDAPDLPSLSPEKQMEAMGISEPEPEP